MRRILLIGAIYATLVHGGIVSKAIDITGLNYNATDTRNDILSVLFNHCSLFKKINKDVQLILFNSSSSYQDPKLIIPKFN